MGRFMVPTQGGSVLYVCTKFYVQMLLGRSQISPSRRPPSRGCGTAKISWRRSQLLPTGPVWWRSMHAISSYRGNRPTNTHTHKPRQGRLQYTAPL